MRATKAYARKVGMGRRWVSGDLVGCARALLVAAVFVVVVLPSPAAADDGGSTLSADAAVRGVVSTGWAHTCAVETDGSLECWGSDQFGQVSGPNAEGGTFTQVSAGDFHTCAIKTDGRLECWGYDAEGRVSGPNAEGGTFTQVSASGSTCAIKTGGSLECWGRNTAGQVSGPNAEGGTFTQVSSGGSHTCALKTDGSLECWGYDGGDGGVGPDRRVSGPNAEGGTFTQVSAGGSSTCAIKTDGSLECWGYDLYGAVSGMNAQGGTFTQVSAGGDQTCAIKTDGSLRCAGWVRGEWSGPNGTYTQVSGGYMHVCAIRTGGTLECWGSDQFGQVSGPNAESGTFSAPAVSIGFDHSCAIKTDGSLECWGSDSFGQVSGPNAEGGTFTQVSAGGTQTCAIKTDGGLECWGWDFFGQVSGPNAGGTFTQVSVEDSYTCAIKTSGRLECWGDDEWGQVSGPNEEGGTFTQVSAGGLRTCAIKTGGSLECWGYDENGEVSEPNAEGGTFTQVSAGSSNTCAIKTDGSLKCWGDDGYGQVSGPDAEGGTFTQVSAEGTRTCAMKTDGSLECWGYDGYDGDGWVSGWVSEPNAEGGTFSQVDAGGWSHTCAIKTGGSLKCWGRDDDGKLGDAPASLGPAPPSLVGAGAYEHSFTSSTGTPSGGFSVTSGSLPPGLELGSAGVLSGTPTQAGPFTFTVTAQNLIGPASAEFTIVVDLTAPSATPSLSPAASAFGWNNGDATVSWHWSDEAGGSGIDGSNCASSSGSSGEGPAIELSAICADLRGNTRIATHTVKVDKMPPSVECAAAPTYVLDGAHSTDVTATVTDVLSGPAAAVVAADVTPADVARTGEQSKRVTGSDRAGNETTRSCPFVVAAPELTLTTSRIVVIRPSTRSVRVICTLDRPRLRKCAIALRAGRRTLARGEAKADAGDATVTVALPIDRRARRLARRPGGRAATLDATAGHTAGPAVKVSISLWLSPSAAIRAPTDGLFDPATGELRRNGTRYLRELRKVIAGAGEITCTGHTDNRGSTTGNRELGLARAKAVCAFLTADTDIKTRARSQGETRPRAPNTTSNGRARNRHVSITVRYQGHQRALKALATRRTGGAAHGPPLTARR